MEVICLDTSVLIDYYRKLKKENTYLYKLIDAYENPRFAITSITLYEIYLGIDSTEQLHFWNSFLQEMEVLSFDSQSALKASSIYQALKSQNKLIGQADILIASIALQHQTAFATINKEHFGRLKHLGLKIVELETKDNETP